MVIRFLLLFLLALPAFAADVGGVKLADKERVGNAELVLNGAGVRKRAFFQIYAAGLYLPEKKTAAAEVLAAAGPKRVVMVMLRDVGADQFAGALADGLKGNHSEAEMRAFDARVVQLVTAMNGIGEAKSGMRITLDWLPESGLQLTVNGKATGAPIAGEDFYRALLKNWVGDKPVQDDLKKALLGDRS